MLPDDSTLVWAAFAVIVVIFLTYLWFVLSAGPKYMAKRNPVDLTRIIRAYNIFQVVACSAYVICAYRVGFDFSHLFKCDRFEFLSDRSKELVQIGCWSFMCLRVIELVETFFFILRKKENQASFLHIFHHITSATLAWMFLYLRPGKSYFISSSLSLNWNDRYRVYINLHRCNQLDGSRSHVLLLLLQLV